MMPARVIDLRAPETFRRPVCGARRASPAAKRPPKPLSDFAGRRVTRLRYVAAGLLLLFSASLMSPRAASAGPGDDAAAELGLPALQPADVPIEPFEPRVPPTEQQQARGEALTWYVTGQVHESRGQLDPGEFRRAVDAYRRAIELDPRAIPVYQSLVPILYALNEKDEARRYALQAAEQRAGGHQLVRGLAAVMAQDQSLQEAVRLLREALEIDALTAEPLPFLLVHRDLGLFLRMSGEPVEAAESFQRVFDALQDETLPLSADERAELLDDAGALYDEMGQTFLDAKLPDLAVRAFDEAAKHRSGRPGIHSFNLALVYRETGRPEEALAELNKYFDAQLQSKGRAAYRLLADLYNDLGRSDQLIPRLEELLEEDPRNSSLAYFLAGAYAEAGRLEQAAELYERTQGTSSNPFGLVGLMEVYRLQAKSDRLLDTLAKLAPQMPEVEDEADLQRLPQDVRDLVEQFQAQWERLTQDVETLDALMALGREREQGDDPSIDLPQAQVLGKLAIDAERTDDAVHFYRLAISMMNQPAPDLYQDLGQFLIDQKEYGLAAEVFQDGADHPALQPVRWMFLFFLSYALEFDGRTDEALEAIREAQRSEPTIAQLRFQEAWIHYHARRWDEATRLFEDVISRFPGDAEVVRNAQFSLSNIYVQQGDMQRGEQILLDVLNEDPDHPQANNDLGYLWADQNKNLERAREMISRALEAEPDNAAYLDSMGWVLYRLGEYEQAREYLQQAADSPDGEDSTILDHLGDVLHELGEAEQARAAWQRALELEQEQAHPKQELLDSLREKLGEAENAASADVE